VRFSQNPYRLSILRFKCVGATGSQPFDSGLQLRVNRKVATTAADSNKQGDVQAMEFGIPGYDDLVWNVSLVCDRISSSTQHGLNGK